MKNTVKKTVFIAMLLFYFLTTNQLYSQRWPGGKECGATEIKDVQEQNNIQSNIDFDILHDIRDNFLKSYPKGLRYIEEYYYISDLKIDYSKLSIGELYDIFKIAPKIYDAYDNIKNSKFNGIIVNEELKTEIIELLNTFKKLSNNTKYITIIEGLIKDTEKIVNKNREQVIEFMKN